MSVPMMTSVPMMRVSDNGFISYSGGVPADATPDAGAYLPPTIDLGTDFDAMPAVRKDRTTSARSLARRQFRRPRFAGRAARVRMSRGWWAVPIVAILFFAVGSVSPALSPLTLVATITVGADASAMVSGPDAIVLDSRNNVDQVSAYDLHGNGLIWRTPLKFLAAAAGVRVVGNVVVVSTADPKPNGMATEVFDAASGRALWSSVDSVLAIDATANLVTTVEHSDNTATLQQVAPRTGRIGWTLQVGAGCSTEFGQTDGIIADRLVELCLMPSSPGHPPIDTPTLLAVDLASGTVNATRALHYNSAEAQANLPPDEQMATPEVAVLGDLTLLIHGGSPSPAVDAFNAITLAPEWLGTPVSIGDTPSVCGKSICLTDGKTVSTIDPLTGKVIGSSSAPDADPAGQLVLVPLDPAHPDARTYPIPQVDTGVNVDVPISAPGSVWVDRQRAAAATSGSTLTRIQPINGVGAASCFTSGDYLVCTTASDQLTLWRLPAG
jgi:putative pyrroloquinoline-quinone binding quinoprotein